MKSMCRELTGSDMTLKPYSMLPTPTAQLGSGIYTSTHLYLTVLESSIKTDFLP